MPRPCPPMAAVVVWRRAPRARGRIERSSVFRLHLRRSLGGGLDVDGAAIYGNTTPSGLTDNPMDGAKTERLRETLAKYMAKKGLRSTEQRRLIVDTFFESPAHITIEELLANVRASDPKVGYATVYRTLKLLAESGVAHERRFGDGVTRYELADDEDEHHDHLICTECQAIIEFEDPRLEEIEQEIAERYGFEVQWHKHELYGVCASCQEKRNKKARNGRRK